MAAEATVEVRQKPRVILGIRQSAIFESIFFMSLIVMISHLFGDGHRFIGAAPNPFTIIVLLVTVQYGTAEGIVCALLAIAFLYVGNVPSMKVGETIFEYQFRLGIMPLFWLVAALVLGELRMRIENQKNSLSERLVETRRELKVITEAYEHLKVIRENLEVNVVLQERTHTTIYRTLKALEVLNPAKILLNAHRVVATAFDAKKFSIFATGPNGMEVVTSEGWEEGDRYLLRIGQDTLLSDAIVNLKRILCVVNPADEKILAGQGVLAGPLVDPETKEVFGMLKIEDFGSMNFNISNLEVFQSLCELLGMTYVNARNYMKIKENGIYHYHPKLFSFSFYDAMIGMLIPIVDEEKKPLTALELTLGSYERADPPRYALDPLLAALDEHLPSTAITCYGNVKTYHLSVLLPFVSPKYVEEIKQRLEKVFAHNELIKKEKVRIGTRTIYRN